MRMKTLLTALAAALIFGGCSQQEVALAQSMANSGAAAAASGKGAGVGNSMVANTLSSPAAMGGMAQSQVIGAQMLANPVTLGVTGLGMALSAQHEAENRRGFNQLMEMMEHSDKYNHNMEMTMVHAYNKQHGTHYKSAQELQYAVKVQGYNKQYGTRFKNMDEVRIDYNRRHGTDYKTVGQLLAQK